MTLFHALILGIVEGVTEFLPISSTAHLMLTAKLLGLADSDFTKSFEIIIQLGAILAVVSLYMKRLLRDWKTNAHILIAFLPTGVVGFLLYPLVKGFFLGNVTLALIMLGIGGLVLIFFEKTYGAWGTKKLSDMTYGQAFVIGCAQALSIVPGVSRAAATILGGLGLGFTREAIVEFSFLLAVPTMAAATGYDFIKNASSFSSSDMTILAVGLGSSFIVARIAVKKFLKFIQRKNFIPFGVYRIVVAVIGLLFLI